MRILSQDGMADLPYESMGICINYHTKTDIIAYPAATFSPDDEYWTLAHYSNEAKARKAIDMLRKACCGNLHIYVDQLVLMAKNYASRPELLKLLNEAVQSVKYFRFPSDDEIEV